MSYGTDEAACYDFHPEHALPEAEVAVWLEVLALHSRNERSPGHMLDAGAGTGLLTSALKAAGYAVIGLEPSAAMIECAVRDRPNLVASDFVRGAAEEAVLFDTTSFDWVVTRQTVCHFPDPQKAFASFYKWLRPGGRVIIVDGVWPASVWSGTAEHLPFAVIQGPKPVAECLSSQGFLIREARVFEQLNIARVRAKLGDTPRYIVVGERR